LGFPSLEAAEPHAQPCSAYSNGRSECRCENSTGLDQAGQQCFYCSSCA
jgi:hypothetical protein